MLTALFQKHAYRVLVQIGTLRHLHLGMPLFVFQLSRHHATPDRGWSGSEVGRNPKLPLMDLLRQLNSEDDAAGVVEALQADHRLQAELHAPVVLLDDVV